VHGEVDAVDALRRFLDRGQESFFQLFFSRMPALGARADMVGTSSTSFSASKTESAPPIWVLSPRSPKISSPRLIEK
jgi:hypothetical protein